MGKIFYRHLLESLNSLTSINEIHSSDSLPELIYNDNSQNKILLLPNQFYIVFELEQMKVIDVSTNIESVLGYNYANNDINFIEIIIHPDDKQLVFKGLMRAVKEIKKIEYIKPFADVFCMELRIQSSFGNYKWFQAQSMILKTDLSGNPVDILIIFSDIDKIKENNTVKMYYFGFNQGKIDFPAKRPLCYIQKNGLTAREYKILEKVVIGLYSKEIASELGITKNTVDTIRRNILRKAQVPNTISLINWVAKNNIFVKIQSEI